MTGKEFQDLTHHVLATLSFAWVQMQPKLLQTGHQSAIDSIPELKGLLAPRDPPVHDLLLKTIVRPSEMQRHLLDKVLPLVLVGIQALAEEALQGLAGKEGKVYSRIEQLAQVGRIDRRQASEAHHWRMIRNVVAHSAGTVDAIAEAEAVRLRSAGVILFSSFQLWGPLLDSEHGGTPVPVTESAAATPRRPNAACTPVDIRAGNIVALGVTDLLAASEVWAELIEAAV